MFRDEDGFVARDELRDVAAKLANGGSLHSHNKITVVYTNSSACVQKFRACLKYDQAYDES